MLRKLRIVNGSFIFVALILSNFSSVTGHCVDRHNRWLSAGRVVYDPENIEYCGDKLIFTILFTKANTKRIFTDKEGINYLNIFKQHVNLRPHEWRCSFKAIEKEDVLLK